MNVSTHWWGCCSLSLRLMWRECAIFSGFASVLIFIIKQPWCLCHFFCFVAFSSLIFLLLLFFWMKFYLTLLFTAHCRIGRVQCRRNRIFITLLLRSGASEGMFEADMAGASTRENERTERGEGGGGVETTENLKSCSCSSRRSQKMTTWMANFNFICWRLVWKLYSPFSSWCEHFQTIVNLSFARFRAHMGTHTHNAVMRGFLPKKNAHGKLIKNAVFARENLSQKLLCEPIYIFCRVNVGKDVWGWGGAGWITGTESKKMKNNKSYQSCNRFADVNDKRHQSRRRVRDLFDVLDIFSLAV